MFVVLTYSRGFFFFLYKTFLCKFLWYVIIFLVTCNYFYSQLIFYLIFFTCEMMLGSLKITNKRARIIQLSYKGQTWFIISAKMSIRSTSVQTVPLFSFGATYTDTLFVQTSEKGGSHSSASSVHCHALTSLLSFLFFSLSVNGSIINEP